MPDVILECTYCGYSTKLSTWEAYNLEVCPKCKDKDIKKNKIETTDYFGYNYKEKKK